MRLTMLIFIAGISVTTFCTTLAGVSQPRSSPLQARSTESNLPPARYRELRLQALAQARLVTGPRLKNPRIAARGLDLDTASVLAGQRAYLGSASSGTTSPGLLLGQRPTLFSTDHPAVAPLKETAAAVNRQRSRSNCESPAIRRVNGRSMPIFTPAEPENHYRIEGCGLGLTPGTVRLLPVASAASSGGRVESIPLFPDGLNSWSDQHIDVHIDPRLRGFPDFFADLIVQLVDGRELQLRGCRFIAVRGEPEFLRAIPAAWVRLDATSVPARAIGQLEFESPPISGEEGPPEAVGSSAFIVRSDPHSFGEGKDVWDFSQLTPGWTIESVQLEVFSTTCPGGDRSPISSGSWTTNWTAHGFEVAWSGDTCSSWIPPVFHFALSSSQYAMKVWVIGPLGTEPFDSSRRQRSAPH